MKYCFILLLSLLSTVTYSQSPGDSSHMKQVTLDDIFGDDEPVDDCLILKTVLNDSNFFKQFRFEEITDTLHILDAGNFINGCHAFSTAYGRIVKVEKECEAILPTKFLKSNAGKNYLTIRYLHDDIDKNEYVLKVWSGHRSIGCNIKFKLLLNHGQYTLCNVKYDFYQY